MKIAWADESILDGAYILGAVVLEEEVIQNARQAAAKLRRPGELKAHWYERNKKDRDAMIGTLRSLPVSGLIVARVPIIGERNERQRRKSMELFLPLLVGSNVKTVTFESRGPKNDQRDRDMLAAMQAQHRIYAPALTMHHARGIDEPILWLADALCGAVVAERHGVNRWWHMVQDFTQLVTLDGSTG